MKAAIAMWRSFWLFWSGYYEPVDPLRVGMLDTGELAIVDDRGATLVFSESTTQLIRSALDFKPQPSLPTQHASNSAPELALWGGHR
jgi:hypothetical protein